MVSENIVSHRCWCFKRFVRRLSNSTAIQMHQLNRERKDIRKNMEDKLRKDLVCQSSLYFVTHIVNSFFLTVGLTIGWIRNSFSAASL